MTEADALEAFRRGMADRGLVPPAEIIADSRLHRCDTAGRHGEGDGAYILHLDEHPAGGFQNWQDGQGWETWSYRNGETTVSAAAREAHTARTEAGKRQNDEERQRRILETRPRAISLWQRGRPADPQHPYLVAKSIKPHGLRQVGNDLLVPMHDVGSRELVNVQRITADGEQWAKRGLPHGVVAGTYLGIGEPDGVLLIAEGFSTAASLYETTRYAAAISFGAGNLEAVAIGLRCRYPNARIVVCADRDSDDTGERAADRAALAVGGVVAIPPDSPGQKADFNDVHRRDGTHAVMAIIESALSRFDAEPGSLEPDENEGSATKADSAVAPKPADVLELDRLSTLDPMTYGRERKDAAKRLGVGVTALDAEVKRHRASRSAHADSSLPGIEPWEVPVDGARLLDELAIMLSRHVGLLKGGADAVALWIAHSHATEAATVTPLLAITSPTPACGKSTLLAVIGRLVPKPLLAANITPAAVFRAVEEWRPTLLIDEADTFLHGNDELRGVLNSGHSRENAYVVRTVGEDHQPRQFSTWAAKAIALIGDPPATLASRAIHITMRRLGPGESVETFRPDRASHLQPLARQSARWAADNIDMLRAADPVMPDGFNNRRADNWRPLFAIADTAGGHWAERARQAALKLDKPDAGQTTPLMLLDDLQTLFDQRDAERLSSAEIVEHLGKLEGRPWPEYGRTQKAITATQLARLLKPFNIFPTTLRIGDSTPKGYMRADFIEVFTRYLRAKAQQRNND